MSNDVTVRIDIPEPTEEQRAAADRIIDAVALDYGIPRDMLLGVTPPDADPADVKFFNARVSRGQVLLNRRSRQELARVRRIVNCPSRRDRIRRAARARKQRRGWA